MSDEESVPAAVAPQKQSSTEHKSWKKVNEERKVLKKKYKQENMLKKLEKMRKLDELTKEMSKESGSKGPKESVSTVSIAVPGSILENAQSAELRTYLAGQIARAVCIFQVDEVIVFDDLGVRNVKDGKRCTIGNDPDNENSLVRNSCLQLARILQYLECPQYLRKFFFPLHNDLKYSGLLNPLDAPHHLRQQNIFMYREGIVTDKKVKEQKGSYVNVGLLNDVLADKCLTEGLRVTVRLKQSGQEQKSKKMRGKIVSPSEPRLETGVYWGYTVRIASSISQIFTQSPYDKGYDLTIGTSDKGSSIHDIEPRSLAYNHALIVYGGLQGLETAIETDEKLTVEDPKLLFDQYINVLPKQGSRTIRTEEAIIISLSALQDKFNPKVQPPEFNLQEYIPQSEDTGLKQYEQINANTKVVSDLSRFD